MHSHGVLWVWLSHGTGLRATDANGLSDPYVRLHLGGATVRTQVIYKTLDPCWDESFQFIRCKLKLGMIFIGCVAAYTMML